MTKRRMELSCNRPRDTDVHSPEGIDDLKRAVRDGLIRKYSGIAMSRFAYDWGDDPRFADMLEMSRDTVPERFLFESTDACFFESEGAIHCLPMVMDGGLNMYGFPNRWRVVPFGWEATPEGQRPDAWVKLNAVVHDYSDSVIIRNSLVMGESDREFIIRVVDMLVDNVLSMNQLQLLARCPFLFDVTEDNLLSAKNFFLAVAQGKPVIFMNALGEDLTPKVLQLNVKIDPALFEIFDRAECLILEQLGIPCVPITKRAQQTVSEVDSSTAKLKLRRDELLNQREAAIDRLNALFGTSVTVTSVIDEMEASYEDSAMAGKDMEEDPSSRGEGDDKASGGRE